MRGAWEENARGAARRGAGLARGGGGWRRAGRGALCRGRCWGAGWGGECDESTNRRDDEDGGGGGDWEVRFWGGVTFFWGGDVLCRVGGCGKDMGEE